MSPDFKKGLYIGLGVLVAIIAVGMLLRLVKLWITSSAQ